MKYKIWLALFFLASLSLVILAPNSALATQGHGGIEGVYAHQIAHLFFIISMGGLIYWLRQRGLVREKGKSGLGLGIWFYRTRDRAAQGSGLGGRRRSVWADYSARQGGSAAVERS